MRRKLFTAALGLFALTVFAGTAFVQTASASPGHALVTKQYQPAGLAQHGIAGADENGMSSRLVTMQPQTNVAILKRQATRLGPHSADAIIHLTVSMKLRDVKRLKQFLDDLQNSDNPDYRDFLTPRQFTERYGPSEKQLVRVTRFLKQHGIEVEDVSPDRLLIHTQASTERYEHALGVRINDYALNGRNFFSTVDSPRLPASIAGLVQNISGLNNAVRMRPMHRLMPLPANVRQSISAAGPAAGDAPPPSTISYFNPHQIAKAYEWPDITKESNGAGVFVAILTAASSNLAASDYENFWSAFGLPDHEVSIIPVDGDEGLTNGTVETLLDMEWSGAMGPGEALNVYVAADPSLTVFLDMYDRFTTDDSAQVMTTSWGAPESAGIAETADAIFMEAAAQGISMFAAAGDRGASDGTDQNNMADYPSASVYITAANGTQLTISDESGAYGSEVAWNDADCFGNGPAATGGAISQIFDKPDWQRGPGVPTGVDTRMNSDLAMSASCSHPFLLYANGGWVLVGGTSAVAPQFAGLFAIGVWQNGGASLGQSNVLIYNDANSDNYADDFRDVTSGCNGKLPDGTPSCAGTNWDHPTGWGSPRATSLLSHLGVQGPAGTLEGTITDAAGGVPLAGAEITVDPIQFHRMTGDAGTYSLRLPVGDYTVTVTAFGYSSQSAPVTITEGNTTTLDFVLETAPTAVLSGHVSDGSGHGYGLYADIKVSAAGFGQVADVWTDPRTGAYSVKLPQGYPYNLIVSTYFDGYDPAQANLTLDGDASEDFSMIVGASCQAPGYAASFGEDFNGSSFPPEGWSVTNAVKGSSLAWQTDTDWGDDNYTGGSGGAATADSDMSSWSRPFDTGLISPAIDVSSLPADPKLQFRLNFQHNASSRDALDVDMRNDDGAWINLAHFVTSQGGFYALPGVVQSIDLSPYIAAGSTTIQFRWRYFDLRARGKDWYAQIDDVIIGACAPTDQGLVAGQVSDANTGDGLLNAAVSDDQGNSTQTFGNPADPNLPAGYYFLFSKLGNRTVTVARAPYQSASAGVNVADGGVNGKDFPLPVGRLAADVGEFNVHVMVNNRVTKTLTLGNTGSAAASWKLHGFNFGPVPGSSEAPAAETAPAGTQINSFTTGMTTYGLGVDHDANDLWIGSPAAGKGDDKDHRFLFDGTNTGETVDTSGLGVGFMADMTYDDRTGTMWQMSLPVSGIRSCIFEFDPRAMQWTGAKVCPILPIYQYALAYDPTSDTWYSAGSFTSLPNLTVYHFDGEGNILDTKYLGLRIAGLAYNPATGHLFALNLDGASIGEKQVVVLDAKNDYARLNSFDIQGFPMGAEAPGFGYDCDGHLWVSDEPEQKVFEVVSGETGWCADKHVPWLTAAPASGTTAAGAQSAVTLSFDGSGQREFTTSRAELLLLGNVPYGAQTIPVTVTWEPQPVDLTIQGTANPSPVEKDKILVYTLTVGNQKEDNHGAAEEVALTYALPAGASFVPNDGGDCEAANDTVICGLGTIAEGASKTVAIAVKTTAAGKLASTFKVAAREPDSDPSTNSTTVTSSVTGVADVSASASGASIPAGGSGTIHLAVSNAGPDAATDVVLKITAGANAKFQSASGEQGGCTPISGSNGFECDLGDVVSGGNVGVDVTAFGAYVGAATVTAQATTSAEDSDQDNNVATATVTVASGGGGTGGGGSSGGGGLGWLALTVLLGLALAGAWARGRRDSKEKRVRGWVAAVAGVALAGTGMTLAVTAHAQVPSDAAAKVIHATKFSRTQPLRDMRWNLPPIMQRILKHRPGPFSPAYLKRLREQLIADGLLATGRAPGRPFASLTPETLSRLVHAKDHVLQRVLSPRAGTPDAFTQPIIGFDGLGHTTGYDGPPDRGLISPDPNLAVGEKYVVQAVNSAFAVFDKSDGSMILGPVAMNSLWAGFGGGCEGNPFYPQNIGGPTIIYDQLAQRWIISRVSAVTAPPVHEPMLECVAISETNNPTGAWYLYAFPIVADRTDFPFLTYPKWGLWRGSYLASWLLRASAGTRQVGFVTAAFDRAAMLKGDPDAPMVEFTVPHAGSPWGYFVLPADLDGQTLPPAGAPGYFLGYSSPNLLGAGAPYALLMWRLSVDWSDPAAAALTGPTEIDVAPFTDLVCGGASRCIPQFGTGPALDTVSDQLMYRLAYRNFGDHEALVVNQTVGATDSGSAPTGVRWYELDTTSPGADDWSLVQQASFAPTDGTSRWMASIAMDHAGDMALGYSLSSANIYPSIAYTGRHAGDPAGEMTEPETVLRNGAGTQFFINRGWGEYTSMAIDPFGDCTFWYTNEYYSDTVAHAWSTRIGAFKFASCNPIPIGTLSGTVTAAATGNPLDDATITLTGDIVLRTDDDGHYRLKLPAGDYTVAASDFGYSPDSVSVTIGDGETTTQDFHLELAPKATLSGKVSDGSGHGYGLYAHLEVASPGFGQVTDAWTDPKTGQYGVSLPEGFDYTVKATAYFTGYEPKSASLDFDGDATQNFELLIGPTCEAPGYSYVFGETFNGDTFPPAGWSIVNAAKDVPVTWAQNIVWSQGNFTGGSGFAAMADSVFYAAALTFDTRLVSPPIAVSSLLADPVLTFKLNYQNLGTDALDVDISVDGGDWQTMDHIVSDRGAYLELPGATDSVPLATYIPPGANSIRFRWRYYDLFQGQFAGWYAQIDDVSIGTCTPLAGGLIGGQVSDANTGNGLSDSVVSDDAGASTKSFDNPNDPGLPAGYYFLFSRSGNRTITASRPPYRSDVVQVGVTDDDWVAQDFALDVGKVSAAPGALSLQVMVNNRLSHVLMLDNDGGAAAVWRIHALNAATSPQPAVTGPFATSLQAAVRNPAALTACGEVTAQTNEAAASCIVGKVHDRNAIRASAAGTTPGAVVATFATGIASYGLGVDHDADDLWLSSPAYGGVNGDHKDHRFLSDGTPTGDAVSTNGLGVLYMADMAYDDRTGMFWQLGVAAPDGDSSCIYELNPRGLQWTGKKICPAFPFSQRGLAYDPVSNTWYAGNFGDYIVYHFDDQGRILDSQFVGLPIIGLAYNAATGHLFALTSGGTLVDAKQVVVLDAKHDYSRLGSFNIQGLPVGAEAAGLGYDCNGHLWVSDGPDQKVFEVESGETGWCALKQVSWLTVAPPGGTLAAGAQTGVTVTFDGSGQKAFTSTQAQLQIVGANTPYKLQSIPVSVSWEPQPVDLVITGQASSESIEKGGNVVYTLTVTNEEEENHGEAQQVALAYVLPAGMNFIPNNGGSCGVSDGTVTCDLGTVALGAAKSAAIAVTANAAGARASTFTVTSREPDSDPSTNSVTLDTTVIGTADLTVGAADATIPASGSGTLHLSVTNAGPDAATDVIFKVTAGASAKLISAASGQGNCVPVSGSNGFSCALGEIASGGSVGVDIAAFGAYAGAATVTGQASTSSTDPNPDNNLATATVTVSANNNGGGGSGGSGGGSLGWLALAALFGLALTGAWIRGRRG